MNAKDLGPPVASPWRQAELGVMAAPQAVGIVNRRELHTAADPATERARLAAAYAGEHLGARVAAREGFIDEVIEPADTRARLAWGLETLGGNGGRRRPDGGNIPL